MDIDVFPAHERATVLRVLRTALAPAGALVAREREFLETYAHIAGAVPASADPHPIAPTAVQIEGAHQRKRLVQLAALAVLLGRPVKPEALGFLKALARHVRTHDPVIDVIDALIKGQRLKIRMLAMRRMMRVMLKEAYLAEGTAGLLRIFGAMLFKAAVNKPLMGKYKRLGLLPDGTLGREYWKFMASEGFNFPGEPAGIPATVSYHDVAHVLAEHEATPLGEIQQGSFQGGNRREDGFVFVQFAILQFHQGVKITPATDGRVDNFEPRKVLWAIHRGATCNVDMTHQWNYWPLMALPLPEARAACGLLPKLAVRV
jgi:hypothetical protein